MLKALNERAHDGHCTKRDPPALDAPVEEVAGVADEEADEADDFLALLDTAAAALSRSTSNAERRLVDDDDDDDDDEDDMDKSVSSTRYSP